MHTLILLLVFVQEYKPPSSKDIPIDFRVTLLKNAPNPVNVLGSKGIVILVILFCSSCVSLSLYAGVGEPPLVMSCSALFAAKRAIESSRAEIGNRDFFSLCKLNILDW